MGTLALIQEILKWGTTPAILILAALVGLLLKKQDKNGKDDAERSIDLRKLIEALAAATEARFIEHRDRMAAIERDYLPREAHYKDIGGWRTDMAQLRGDVAAELRGIRTEMSTTNTNLLAAALKGAKNGC